MKVVSGSSSKKLVEALVREIGCTKAEVTLKRFPDDECYVRIDEDLNGEEILLVSNSYPDRNIIELFLLQDALRNFEIKSLTTLIPYFGYARQDKIFEHGEVVSAMSMAGRIGTGSDKIILVDVHEPKITQWFDRPAISVSAMTDIGKYLAGKGVDIIISPDLGALEMAKTAARAANAEFDYIVKHRINEDTVRMDLKSLNVQGKCIGIVDDMISTGGTIRESARNIYLQGGRKVYAVCTHGLFSRNALEMLKVEVDGVYSTDTIENPCSVISVASVIKEALFKN
ncbi:MAG: ribose-phosphate diphosphokinase [Candidatus Thermoplasmatota archaeon]|jgi:ribose-phosphate pyrophosphokinase|nr:ribose-phosphate diphosphokinase [Candidatus Thermoplasmatota archaeon]MDP7264259.1 ribose-phosphate diphosphokinase [Candidatus Thermoplasmatota archaeon]